MGEAKIRYIEHTADTGIEVEAGKLADLFVGAARGMFSLMVDLSGVDARVEQRVSLDASDLTGLMFAWLNELLFLADSRGLLFSEFRVASVDESSIEAAAGGEELDADRHLLGNDVKAATYHQMVVERRDGGWFARVIFDV